MQAGRLDKRINIRMKERTPDGQGGFNDTWPVIATVWGEMLRPRFSDGVDSGTHAVTITQGIRIRRRNIEQGWKVDLDGREYNVIHVDNSTRGETIMTCIERRP